MDEKGAGVEIKLSFTGPESNGAKWAQYYETIISNGTIISSWDDGDTHNRFYYTFEELKEKTNGNTISFYDRPDDKFCDYAITEKFSLFLFNKNNEKILSLYYGYSNSGNESGNITTIFPLTVGYPINK